VGEPDALALALTCRALRDALWARFPLRTMEMAAGRWTDDGDGPRRLRTPDGAVVATVARLLWVRGLPSRPAWLDGAPADPWPPAIFSRVALVLDVKVILTPPYIFQY
jgi:hypothetical protein